ncbi:hypothetical protein JQ604_12565 [Bradyrhizobium jicamae]|uniref:hypothetical protein n=1 Tax=Bradyrhizobium jicamae TaxID=280332 RepID=UPI001BAAEEB6|nr:hypothetical protein [Bradyrhizobium jicamae]MBR0753019.1 hypothetical protein [Bradyrhizobium jicamae]
MRVRLAAIAAVVVLGGLSAVAAYEAATPRASAWREIAWPFPRDGWPAGRAFRCDAASCGDEVEVYVRPKLGFCNCTTGVADDDEVDRVADVDLISERFVPVKEGEAVHVGDMAGRARLYDLGTSAGVQRTAIGIAVSHRCDLLVAAAQGRGSMAGLQQSAMNFLALSMTQHWLKLAMEGR